MSGRLGVDKQGPAEPRFPLFGAENQALSIQAGGSSIRVADPGTDSVLDFDLGDTITIEAWVNPTDVAAGQQVYIVGKGRTQNPGVAENNQNYALRLRGVAGTARLSFLFRSAASPHTEPAWHRWNSDVGFEPDGDWHYVAVSYKFGDPASIRGWIDAAAVPGNWDYAGATKLGPVVDDDELWIGSSMGGGSTSTFRGSIDEVAVYRTALTPERIEARYKVVGPPPPKPGLPELAANRLPANGVLVEIFEGIPDGKSWSLRSARFVEDYVVPSFAFPDVPKKYSPRGVQIDRSDPFLIRATGRIVVPPGKKRILVRCHNASRLSLDGRRIAETPFHSISSSAHGRVFPIDTSLAPHIRPLQRGDTEKVVDIAGDGRQHLFQFVMIAGGQNHRPEFGETGVFMAEPDTDFQVLSSTVQVALTDRAFPAFLKEQRALLADVSTNRRREASAEEDKYWRWRHALARRYLAATPGPAIPEVSPNVPIHNDIDRFIGKRLEAAGEAAGELVDDLAFLRRVTLDVIGTVPTLDQVDKFLNDPAGRRRELAIDRLLAHPGWADHWVSYWQDVLAENPNIVNPTLNNTGPFRWWIHESLIDNKPFDRFATELIMMEGSKYYGGPAGFELATENDAPLAAKAHIVGQAFMALEMKCARCHDAPYHDFGQKDLFSMAAMLKRGPQPVPKTSSIPGGDEAVKSLLVEVTLKPGEQVAPRWSFAEWMPDELPAGVLRDPDDSRERLAALITAPRNQRFARVIVNRIWRRYMGRGLVRPVDDWETAQPSHPELLDFLARELLASGYDQKHVARLILNSHSYQRVARGKDAAKPGKEYLFAAPLQRRMTAEQLVDSMFVVCGKPFDAGMMAIDIDGARPPKSSLHLGEPTRAWHFASLSNERDRPSLALPYAQPFVTVLETFGWRGSRQDPVTVRSDEPTVLQPGILANGVLGRRVTRLSDDSAFTQLALQQQPVSKLVDQAFLQMLTRHPSPDERETYVSLLSDGYSRRIVTPAPPAQKRPRLPRGLVSWSNHLDPRANEIKVELQEVVRRGDPPTRLLTADWRERMEDMIWALMNSPEFVFVP
jgi:hypothetical protein